MKTLITILIIAFISSLTSYSHDPITLKDENEIPLNITYTGKTDEFHVVPVKETELYEPDEELTSEIIDENSNELISKFYAGTGFSLINSYKTGNVLDFWQNINNDNSEKIEQATGFFEFKFGYLGQVDKSNWIGIEDQIVITPSHALWGTNLFFGGRNEIHFRAALMNITLSYGHALDKNNNILLMIQPGLDLGYMSGSVTINNNYYKQSLAIGIGGHGAVGMDYFIGKNLITNLRMGYRYISINETHQDVNSETGYSTFYVEGTDGEMVKADWSGLYLTLGVSFSINKK